MGHAPLFGPSRSRLASNTRRAGQSDLSRVCGEPPLPCCSSPPKPGSLRQPLPAVVQHGQRVVQARVQAETRLARTNASHATCNSPLSPCQGGCRGFEPLHPLSSRIYDKTRRQMPSGLVVLGSGCRIPNDDACPCSPFPTNTSSTIADLPLIRIRIAHRARRVRLEDAGTKRRRPRAKLPWLRRSTAKPFEHSDQSRRSA